MTSGDRGRRTLRGACPHDCPDTCAWLVDVVDDRIEWFRGDSTHPFSKGSLCEKVAHYPERTSSEDRVLQPMRRIGEKGEGLFEPIDWATAVDEIGGHLQRIREAHGGQAILPYSYMGTQGALQAASLDRAFFDRIGATRLQRDICGSTAAGSTRAVLGTATGVIPEQLTNCRVIVLWGTNTMVTNRHLWPFILQARREHGCKLVVVDPVRTQTAQQADLHLRPKPGSDVLLALALVHNLVARGYLDHDYIARHTVGFEHLSELAALVSPDIAERRTGVTRADLDTLTSWFGELRPACIRVLVGMERTSDASDAFEVIASIPAVVGAWRDEGGGLCHLTIDAFQKCLDLPGIAQLDGALPEPPPPIVNMVQLGQALAPDADPEIHLLFVYNSNPADSAPNQTLVRSGLAREDLVLVVAEQFMTDTTSFADYVLPATTQLEHWDLMWSWGHAYLALNQPAVPARGLALPNTELFRRLAARLGFTDKIFSLTDEKLIARALATPAMQESGVTTERLRQVGWLPIPTPPAAPFAAT